MFWEKVTLRKKTMKAKGVINMLTVGFLASVILFAASTWAIYSHCVNDGVIIKKCLIVIAFGACGNIIPPLLGHVPTDHADKLIICAFDFMFVWSLYRIHKGDRLWQPLCP